MMRLALLALSVIGVGATSLYVRGVRLLSTRVTIPWPLGSAGATSQVRQSLVLPMTINVTGHALVADQYSAREKKTNSHRGLRGRRHRFTTSISPWKTRRTMA
ncbi:hypothetical protein BJV74DRAFT_851533 [Russula compacta]|nr:hypothetical protein BJV74DRAFT_851533 [Russula compacta]